ncbi:hypothetical protein ABEF95_011275 [Exophiala dermatitidis]
MKKSGRTIPNTVEYKPPKRKKSTDGPVQYSDRWVDWEEQKRLGKKFREVGKGSWPAADILDERYSGKKREYLVSWEPHPETKEIFRPTWVAADSVGDGLIASWKEKNKHRDTTQNGHTRRQSNGQPVTDTARKPKPTRTIRESSSELQSQTTARRASIDASSSSKVTNGWGTSKIPGTRRQSHDNLVVLSSTPIEIAETQQATSQPASISVSIPRAQINRDDYESLHSSQILSDGGLPQSFSPGYSQSLALHPSSQPAASPPLPKRIHPVLPNSSEESATQEVSHIPPTEFSGSGNTQQVQPINGASQPPRYAHPILSSQQSPQTAALASQVPQPLTRGIASSITSPASGGVNGPEYVPSTGQQSSPHREVSGELGSSQARRVLSVQELAGGPAPRPDALPPTAGFNPSENSSGSSVWQFETQVPAAQQSVISPQPSGFGPSNGRRQLSEGFRSPVRSQSRLQTSGLGMAQPDVPSPSRLGLVPGDAALPMSSLPDLPSTGGIAERARPVGNQMADAGQVSSSNETGLHMEPMASLPAEAPAPATEPVTVTNDAPSVQPYDTTYSSALHIRKSIEEEPQDYNDEQSSNESKLSSSQQSVENERDIGQVDGLVQPSHPILGPDEYALALPAEGKIQSTYLDTINAKRKAILKFINRHESIGSSNGSPNRTHERNEMVELMQRLHDTTTHLDLGLPGFGTQYLIKSEHHAAYANYAGSKFSFLGHLVDMLKNVSCSIIVMAQAGPIQDLLEQYLNLKHINVKRHDRVAASQSPTPDRPSTEFQVHLVSTGSTHQVSFSPKPVLLMIAFDASFDWQDPQVARIRRHFAPLPPRLLPVIHLLISNSSEHVDRCLPKSMPSPLRLKALVRATYQAGPNLGGKPTYVPDPSDEPEGRPMDFSDLQKALRKSPERKLAMLASIVARASLAEDFDAKWNLGPMPELQLTELEDTSAKASGTVTVAETPKEPVPHSRTPVSRADTPSGKKRLLDVDGALPPLGKRQRLTPLRDSQEAGSAGNDAPTAAQLQELVNKLQSDLITERNARQEAERERDRVQEQLDQWKKDHAALQRRYEKRMTKCHELESMNKKLTKTIENNKARYERVLEDNSNLKSKVAELKQELTSVREEIKNGGGDAAALEAAREEARTLVAKNVHLEKSLENTRKDFEFTRSQYQDASNKAAEFANQVRELEEKVEELSKQAGDEKRRLKETNFEDSIKRHLAKISELELERKSKDMLLRKLEEENRALKRNRGVQTRGSSVQPPGSPGLDGHGGRGTRSRPSSPAPGLFVSGHHSGTSNRGSLLRHER